MREYIITNEKIELYCVHFKLFAVEINLYI